MMNPIILSDLEYIINSSLVDWQRFKNKVVLVTGANGMLPAYMVYVLLYLNQKLHYNVKVLGLVRNLKKAKQRFADFQPGVELEFLVQDVSDEIKYEDKIDFIIHAASQASPKYYGVDPVGTINANIFGTTNILKLANKTSAESVLYFSSGEVYGILPIEDFPVKEDMYGYVNPTNVRSCYAESKRMGENLCVCWNYQYGVKVKIVRPFHTYGPGVDLSDGRVFADFCKNIINSQDIILRSNGEARRAFCYIKDAVLGFFKVLLDGNDGEAYNIGNPSAEISIYELAQLLVSLYPEKKLLVRKEFIEGDLTTVKMKSPLIRSCPNIAKAMELGWIPITSIEEGFLYMVDSLIWEMQ